jgi:hypothetical protein
MTADARVGRLRAELEAAFRNRGDLYRLMLAHLEARLGAADAEAMLTDIVEARGREIASSAFADHISGDPVALGEAFLRASPDEGRLYPAAVTRTADAIAFKVHACPLKSAWVDAGLGEREVARLCRIAGAFDKGLFEACGVRFENRTWTPGEEGCCWIRLSGAEPGDFRADDAVEDG